MMKYQAVIFDLDGTLTDSAPGILAGACHALNGLGRDIPKQAELRRFLGPPLLESFIKVCDMTDKDASRAERLYRKYYKEKGYLENDVFPGIRRLLAALKSQGAHVGVATQKPKKPSELILKAFDLFRYVDALGAPDGMEVVSKAELIRRANPRGLTAVMVGDVDTDIIGAREAGADSVAALYGYGSHDALRLARPDWQISDVSALYPILELEEEAPSGYFLTFEGNDGSGKSTQARLLAERLRQIGHEVVLTREPGGTKVGEKIREILLDRKNTDMEPLTEAMLYAAARAQHVRQVILPALKKGHLVISDRYVDSSLAYQGAGRNLGFELVQRINDPAIAGCMPDATVFLSLDPAEGITRRSRSNKIDRLEQEENSFHARVAAAFQGLVENDPRFITVTSQGNKSETAEQVYKMVRQRLIEDRVP